VEGNLPLRSSYFNAKPALLFCLFSLLYFLLVLRALAPSPPNWYLGIDFSFTFPQNELLPLLPFVVVSRSCTSSGSLIHRTLVTIMSDLFLTIVSISFHFRLFTWKRRPYTLFHPHPLLRPMSLVSVLSTTRSVFCLVHRTRLLSQFFSHIIYVLPTPFIPDPPV